MMLMITKINAFFIRILLKAIPLLLTLSNFCKENWLIDWMINKAIDFGLYLFVYKPVVIWSFYVHFLEFDGLVGDVNIWPTSLLDLEFTIFIEWLSTLPYQVHSPPVEALLNSLLDLPFLLLFYILLGLHLLLSNQLHLLRRLFLLKILLMLLVLFICLCPCWGSTTLVPLGLLSWLFLKLNIYRLLAITTHLFLSIYLTLSFHSFLLRLFSRLNYWDLFPLLNRLPPFYSFEHGVIENERGFISNKAELSAWTNLFPLEEEYLYSMVIEVEFVLVYAQIGKLLIFFIHHFYPGYLFMPQLLPLQMLALRL